MEPLVSIVLPIYNGQKYMRESIESVLMQTYSNWELLILDDCSTDGTSEIIKEYLERDARISYYRNEHNLRLPRNLNRGFSLTKGDYLTWTSDDNRFHPTALEKMVRSLQVHGDAQFVYASCRIINDVGEEIEYIMVNNNSKRDIVGTNTVGACFMYTRKAYETVGEYDPDYTLVEDFDYWQRIASHFEVTVIPEILYDYRWHDGALTSTMRKDTFHQNLEKCLLKNRPAFGKLSMMQNYVYYKGLYTCRKNLGAEKNPYKVKYKVLCLYYFWFQRVPNKIRRMSSR